MERTLKNLFDFQKFEGNSDLQRIINSTHSRYATRELSLNEMEWVSAAGIPGMIPDDNSRKEEPDGHQH